MSIDHARAAAPKAAEERPSWRDIEALPFYLVGLFVMAGLTALLADADMLLRPAGARAVLSDGLAGLRHIGLHHIGFHPFLSGAAA